ncbi:MAG: hypothetical protein J1E42_02330 [Akkermansiaceae bacterium]|nr:hypothetical protein [Akkermansiaceae bacterium]
MKLKSITFRCSTAQFERLESTLRATSADTRTAALSSALEEFLDFAEQQDSRALDLFALVDRVDHTGSGPTFAEQA